LIGAFSYLPAESFIFLSTSITIPTDASPVFMTTGVGTHANITWHFCTISSEVELLFSATYLSCAKTSNTSLKPSVNEDPTKP
jgi:hypothetical protein